MNKSHIFGIILLVAVIAIIALLQPKGIVQAPTTQAPIENPIDEPVDVACAGIEITSPVAGSQVTFPLTITGIVHPVGNNAPGTWIIFEAVAGTVTVRDAANTLYSQYAPINLTGDWMNNDPQPFSVTIAALTGTPASNSVNLVFVDDNPSGDPAMQHTCIVPVQL